MYQSLCLATGASLQEVCIVEVFVVGCEVPMAYTGSNKPAKHPAGEFVFLGLAFFCMRPDIKGLVGLQYVPCIYYIYICTELLFYFALEVYWRRGNIWVVYSYA